MVSAWRNFKNLFSRPVFTIIFRPEMLRFHPYSILTRDKMVGFVILGVLSKDKLQEASVAVLVLSYINAPNADAWDTSLGQRQHST